MSPWRAKTDGGRVTAALVLSGVTGCAALGHETLWTRRLVDLLGCSLDATTLVFCMFFLGLALGSMAARRLIESGRSPWRLAAISQFLTALFALPVLYAPGLSSWLWPLLGPERIAGPAGLLVRWAVATALLVPPALFTGMTLPFLAHGALTAKWPMRTWGAVLYGINTAGGIAGTLLTGFWLLPAWGVTASGWGLCALNLGAGLFCWGDAAPGARPSDRTNAGTDMAVPAPPVTPWALAFGSGAVTLAAEMLVIHQLDQVLVTSVHSVAVVLALVLFAFAAGAGLSVLVRDHGRALAIVLWFAAVVAVVEPFLMVAASHGLEQTTPRGGMAGYLIQALQAGGLSVLPLFTLAGMFFPVVFSWTAAAGSDTTGRNWGSLLFINCLGAMVGAQLAQFALMPLLGLWGGMAAIGVAFAVFALLVRPRRKQPGAGFDAWWVVRLASVALAAASFPGYRSLPMFHPREGHTTPVEVKCGREGVVVTAKDDRGELRILLNNSYVIGGTASARLDHQQMLLPLLLHPAPRVVGVIGIGTGITAGAALRLPEVERLKCVEISPLVIGMGRTHFAAPANGLYSDPRSRIIVTDGRLYMAACADRFDVVMADLFIPWRAGEGRLYTVEHFQAVKHALRDGGMFCQWLPLYQLTRGQVLGIMKTFESVFPGAWLVRNSFAHRNPFLGLVGFKDGSTPAWDVLSRRCEQLRNGGQEHNVFLRHPQGLAMFLLGPVTAAELPARTPLNTLNNAWIEHQASEAFVSPAWQPCTGPAWVAFTREHIEQAEKANGLADPVRGPTRAGQLWIEAQEAYTAKAPDLTARLIAAIRAVPPEVAADPAFSWTHLLVDEPLQLPGQRGTKYVRP